MRKMNSKCDICDKPTYLRPKQRNLNKKAYCSLECLKIARAKIYAKQGGDSCSLIKYKIYIEKWKEGLEDGLRGKHSLSNHIRKYIFDKYNNKCCKCNWSKINTFSNKISLEINHIDGNYLNNKEENLELICPNCHSLTKNYKGLNRGNGRKDRYNS